MPHDEDIEKVIDRIAENCKLLEDGYDEPVEYAVWVAYHRGDCEHYQKTRLPKGCDCPKVQEKRKRSFKRPGLLNQLRDYEKNKDVDRNPKAARGAPRVKTPKLHPELNGFLTLDEIVTDIYRNADRWMEELGRDRNWATQPVHMILSGMARQAHFCADERPDIVHAMDRRAIDWVSTARRCLKITVADSIFEGTVCGSCGGGLATPWGGEEPTVRCVGTPTVPPCGEEYPMSEWLKIFEMGRR